MATFDVNTAGQIVRHLELSAWAVSGERPSAPGQSGGRGPTPEDLPDAAAQHARSTHGHTAPPDVLRESIRQDLQPVPIVGAPGSARVGCPGGPGAARDEGQVYCRCELMFRIPPLSRQKVGAMPNRRSVTRIAVLALLAASGGLAMGADQFSALAQRLEDAMQPETPEGNGAADVETEDPDTAAARAEDEGYPLGHPADEDTTAG